MAGYNTSSAYDFDLFQPQETSQAQRNAKSAPKLRVIERRESVKSRIFMLKAVGCIAVFFTGVIGIILAQTAFTEVTKQYSDKAKELNVLQSEYRILETKLESSLSLNNIEATVTRKLGMSKLREDQVTYVNLTPAEPTDLVKDKDNSFLGKIKDGFSAFLEYLKPAKNTME